MDILVGRKKWNHWQEEATLLWEKGKELKGRMYVRKESGNVTRIKTGIAIEGNWGN